MSAGEGGEVRPPARRWDGPALLFALLFPSVMAYVYFVHQSYKSDEANPNVLGAFAVGKTIQFAFPLVYVILADRRIPRPGRPTARGMLLGLGFALFVAAGMLALYYLWLRRGLLAGDSPAKIFTKLQEFDAATPGRFVALALFISVLHALLEEYYWRWFVFGRLRLHLPLWRAVYVSSLGFMAHHVIVLDAYLPGRFWEMTLPFSLAVAAGGGFWAWLYARSDSLYAPWLSHMLIDLAIMAVGYDLVSRYWQ
jgi:membrane protease YdiL (CAAX protease family)